MDIKFSNEEKVFAYRVAGIIRRNNKILVQKYIDDINWALPGGKCQFGEYSYNTLKREVLEETGIEIEVEKLLFINELFYNIEESCKNHQIVMYYNAHIVKDTEESIKDEFLGIEKDKKIIYKWIDIRDIAVEKIKPDFLKTELLKNSKVISHIIDDERKMK